MGGSKRYWRLQGGSLSPCSEPPLSIVRPDPPQELILQQRGEQLHLAWAPPASWPLPKSYFALLYHLQYELHNGTQVTRGALPRGTLHSLPHVPTLPCPHPVLSPPCPVPTLPHLWLSYMPRKMLSHGLSSLCCFPFWGDELSPLAVTPAPPSAAGVRVSGATPPRGSP